MSPHGNNSTTVTPPSMITRKRKRDSSPQLELTPSAIIAPARSVFDHHQKADTRQVNHVKQPTQKLNDQARDSALMPSPPPPKRQRKGDHSHQPQQDLNGSKEARVLTEIKIDPETYITRSNDTTAKRKHEETQLHMTQPPKRQREEDHSHQTQQDAKEPKRASVLTETKSDSELYITRLRPSGPLTKRKHEATQSHMTPPPPKRPRMTLDPSQRQHSNPLSRKPKVIIDVDQDRGVYITRNNHIQPTFSKNPTNPPSNPTGHEDPNKPSTMTTTTTPATIIHNPAAIPQTPTNLSSSETLHLARHYHAKVPCPSTPRTTRTPNRTLLPPIDLTRTVQASRRLQDALNGTADPNSYQSRYGIEGQAREFAIPEKKKEGKGKRKRRGMKGELLPKNPVETKLATPPGVRAGTGAATRASAKVKEREREGLRRELEALGKGLDGESVFGTMLFRPANQGNGLDGRVEVRSEEAGVLQGALVS